MRENQLLKDSDSSAVRVAIIVPAYGQPALTAEALRSALSQETDFSYAIVLVNDGCPDPSTRDIGLTFATANPGRIFYLQKSNGGLSAARNTGIDFALAAFPELEAVYFLDCDNRIGPHLLQRLLTALRTSEEHIGWAYADVDKFGFAEFGDTSGPYSPLEHLFRNVSEAGSMAARRMLDAGIRFDTQMRRGVEDWEFWLQGLERGFHGVHVPDAGFRYRRRGESMLVAAERDFGPILDYIRSRHPSLFRPEALLAREIAEKSRYAIYHPDTKRVSRLTAPSDRECLNRDDYLRRLLRSRERPEYGRCPGHLVVMDESLYDVLAERRMLAGILWTLECAVRRATFAAVSFRSTVETVPSWLRENILGDHTGVVPLPNNAQIIALEASVLLSHTRPGSKFDRLPVQAGKRCEGLVLTANMPGLPPSEQNAAAALTELGETLAGLALREHAHLWRAAPLVRYRSHPAMPRDIYAHLGLSSIFPCAVQANDTRRAALVVEPGFPGALAAADRMRDLLSCRGWNVDLVIIGDEIEAGHSASHDYTEIVLLPREALRVSSGAGDYRIYNGTVIPCLDGFGVEDAIATLAAYQLVVSVASTLAHTIMGSLRHLKIETCCLLHTQGSQRSPADLINACAAFEQAYDAIVIEDQPLFHLCRAFGIPQRKLHLWRDLAAAAKSAAPITRITTTLETLRA
ncbi:glycosyltransferase family 2 protein [Microvirga alba]|uniref:glycosyltransferase family 2 protein n=1 Tax=Microvirga alba TaxID=2791025 RepID=UPI001AEE2766|nr:glycosyltransferase family A protein [Microvirga alba]